MSLINDMLRDLDRRGVFAPGSVPGLGPMTVPRERARLGSALGRHWPHAALVAISIVLLGAFGWRAYRPASPHSDASPLAAPHMDVQVARAQDAQERPPHTDVQVALHSLRSPRAQDAQEQPGTSPSLPRIQSGDTQQRPPHMEVPVARAQDAQERPPHMDVQVARAQDAQPPPDSSPAAARPAPVALLATAPSTAKAAADVRVATAPPRLRIEHQDAAAAAAEDSERWAAQRLQAAAAALTAARNDEAEELLRSVLQRQPQRLRARQSLASLYLLQGRREAAVALLEEGLRLDPRPPALAQLLGRVHLEDAEPARAAAVLAKAPPALAEDPAYHALLAAAWQQAGRPDRAAEVYQALLRQNGSVGAWWLGLGLAQEMLGEGPQALQAFERARASGDLEAGVLRYLEQRIRALEAGKK